MFAVLGASGGIGSKIASALLKRGESVRAVGRNPQKLESLRTYGASLYIGQLSDPVFLTKCLKGCRAAFVMIPPDYHSQNLAMHHQALSESIREAIQNSGIHYVVNLSAFGAEHSSGTGLLQGLRAHEQRLNRLESAHILHLRPGFLMENLLNFIPSIRQSHQVMGSLKADLPIPMVASLDVARVATESLLSRSFDGKNARSILGPRDVSMSEICFYLSKILEQKIEYHQLSDRECERFFLQMGLSMEAARQVVELYGAYNSGLINTQNARDEMTTTTTRVEDFLRAFRGIFFEDSDFGKQIDSHAEESPPQH